MLMYCTRTIWRFLDAFFSVIFKSCIIIRRILQSPRRHHVSGSAESVDSDSGSAASTAVRTVVAGSGLTSGVSTPQASTARSPMLRNLSPSGSIASEGANDDRSIPGVTSSPSSGQQHKRLGASSSSLGVRNLFEIWKKNYTN